MTKKIAGILTFLVMLWTALACAEAGGLAAMNGKRIGVQTGTNFDEMIQKHLPESKIEYYNSRTDLLAALEGHKIDGFVVDEPVAEILMRESSRVTYLPEYLDNYEFAAVFRKGTEGEKLRDQFNVFLSGAVNGTLDELEKKWFAEDESTKTMPDIRKLPATNGTMRVATELGYVPFDYFRDGTAVGYDMELAYLFCESCGYGLEFLNMNFDGILPALQAGKCDLVLAGVSITPERAESNLFSDPYFSGGTVMVVLKEEQEKGTEGPVYSSLKTLNTARIGIPSGTSFDLMVQKALPGAKLSYYNSQSDLLTALDTGKIDAFPTDEPSIRYIMGQNASVTYIPEYLSTFEFAYCFNKTEAGQKLRDEFSEFISEKKEEGFLDALSKEWFDAAEGEKKVVDIASLPAPRGTLVMATDGDYAPFEYMRNGQIVGYDVDLAAQFCRAYGYGLKIEVMSLDAVLAAVQSGKCDFGGSAITITPERAESVLFSEPNYTGGTVMAIAARLPGKTDTEQTGNGFLGSIAESFEKTFVREQRWKLFLEGTSTTLLITLLSALFGTALGFLVFMACRNGNVLANGITRVCVSLVKGMPMVVLLMILFYVIFGSVSISGIWVAVIGFTFTFGSAVYGLLVMGVGTIDVGQYEAAYALGHSNRETFFRIILPQAIPRVLPGYQDEIISLIKATAIVGYIAVQDLTKMGDIVRSRTYEAFFPLIAITVIYFVLEMLLILVISRVRISINPKKRSPESILKGVNLHD
ncbi:MAG: transporter substrate-binding domain-containing protein [Clostridia bacterium]|nr:transporter substrate-binding domain-containing protein [Clostridia bacterium]